MRPEQDRLEIETFRLDLLADGREVLAGFRAGQDACGCHAAIVPEHVRLYVLELGTAAPPQLFTCAPISSPAVS
ncbi:hypothetical protein ACFPRL_10030 [Pseudoclavibacter helvolus]